MLLFNLSRSGQGEDNVSEIEFNNPASTPVSQCLGINWHTCVHMCIHACVPVCVCLGRSREHRKQGGPDAVAMAIIIPVQRGA